LSLDTQFVQREKTNRIDGETFLDIIIFHNDNLKQQSLDDLGRKLEKEYGISISKEGLNKKFDVYAIRFVAAALERFLAKQLETPLDRIVAGKFSRILVKDSVCFQLSPTLAQSFPGSGGNGSKAGIRIQFEYEILSGTITDLSIHAFNEQDAKDSTATVERTQAGDLILRDLGYMNTKVLKKLIERCVIFVCRVKNGIKIFELIGDEYVAINLVTIANYMKKHHITQMEKEVYYGAREKLKVRLVIYLLPAEAYAKRLKKAVRDRQRERRDSNLTKQQKALAELNLFVTNADSEQIPTENVWPIYRLRWQIELMFKTWKSICEIDKVMKKVKPERLLCYVYSKLIFIVLCWKMLWAIAKSMYYHIGKSLSFYKALKTLYRDELREFHAALASSKQAIVCFMITFYETSMKYHLLEKRLKEPTPLEIILTCLI
jgi:hypothetical protein